MNTYSLQNWYGKYIVVKTVPGIFGHGYLKSFRNGEAIWYRDPLYARAYTYKTAMHHLRTISADDQKKEA